MLLILHKPAYCYPRLQAFPGGPDALPGAGYETLPRGSTHLTGWPVTSAIRS
jgi:hypothetical protein